MSTRQELRARRGMRPYSPATSIVVEIATGALGTNVEHVDADLRTGYPTVLVLVASPLALFLWLQAPADRDAPGPN